jgi:hypothetical protein
MRIPTTPIPALRRLSSVGMAVALLVGGGAAFAVAALSAGSAGADTTSSTTTTTTATGNSGSGSGSGSGTTLGGFTVSALAEASTAQYEQPNFPLPSTPSLEFDEGYAATNDHFGPSGSAVASSLYPGQVVANAGPELGLLVPGLPLPPAPVWPVDAVSGYPQTPNTASTDQPGVNMDATSTGNANTATASIGDDAPTAGTGGGAAASTPTIPYATSLTGALSSLLGTTPTTSSNGNPLAEESSLMGIGFSSGTSTSGATGGTAVATGTAVDTGISILGGLISIGGVTTTATASSDGTTGTVTGSTVLSNVSIAGEPVTIDANGIHAAGSTAPAVPISSLNSTLSQLGISLSLTNAVDTLNGPAAARTLNGLSISIDLTTLDDAANKVLGALPASDTSQLPVAVPNKQIFTLDLGSVTVSSAAAPGFAASGNSGSADSGAAGDSALGSLADGSFGDGGSGDTGGGGGNSSTGGTATSAHTGIGKPTSAITPIFTGIGAGLVLLGLAAAAALAYGYKRVDDATELVGPVCSDGDPLSARFLDGDDSITDAGGIGL